MKKYSQFSIWDNLMSIIPEFKNNITKNGDYIDPIAAQSLYNIWRVGAKDSKNNIYNKPFNIGQEEINRMKSAGLIKAYGDKIELTRKGEKTIKIMILGDDKSTFDDDGSIIDYYKALNNTRGIKTAKNLKKAQKESWWERFNK